MAFESLDPDGLLTQAELELLKNYRGKTPTYKGSGETLPNVSFNPLEEISRFQRVWQASGSSRAATIIASPLSSQPHSDFISGTQKLSSDNL